MRTVHRLLYRDIASSVVFVALAFLSLFFFIDLVDELDDLGRGGYTLWYALLHSLLEVPGHFYELFPIAVLIGTIFSMARLAQSSEFTILRTAGLGPGRALSLLATLGVAAGVLTFVVGDYVAPSSRREAVDLKARLQAGGLRLGRTGAWLKERRATPQGVLNVSVNVSRAWPGGELEGIRIFEFDADGRLLTRIAARRGLVDAQGHWQLEDVLRTRWIGASPATQALDEPLARLTWPSSLGADVVAAAVLPPATMSTVELGRYASHLAHNEQAVQRYAIQFWRRALYPLACLVMVSLALPFAYLHTRAGGLSFKMFGGVMLGIVFVLLNNVAGHLGLLRDWTPWIVAAAPSAVFLLLSLAAFSWLVRYR